jgi:hypothetical protein
VTQAAQLIVAVLSICACMFLQDVLGVGLTISQSRGLTFYPGFFDALGDYAGKYGGAIVAVAAVHFGLWSIQTFIIVTACAVTSFFTSNLATGKESMILPKSRADHVSLTEAWRRLIHRSTDA